MAKTIKNSLHEKSVTLGICYYPEHWSEDLWDSDFARMKEYGFTYVRIAEFAWALFEPEEGSFEFSLFDRALDLAHAHGLKIIMCTPTATPPAWLTSKYPEVLNETLEGIRYEHGQRRHYNYNAPIYRELCARVVTKMGEHFKDHPSIVGWQIDNEFNCETNVFYSDADHTAFREWVKARYGTLDALNEAWGTVFWSQTYTDWSQIHLPRPTPSGSPNPHLALDEKRFVSDSVISFADNQASILRQICKQHWITTNGLFGHLENHELTEKTLDFISYDSYPNFGNTFPDEGPDALLDRKWSMNLSGVRDISPNFMIMEQQSGSGGWVNRMYMPTPEPGQIRLWTYQSIAHGADAVLYFRWRTATIGTEIYWHGIHDYDNRENRRAKEVQQIGRELKAVGENIAGTKVYAEIALLSDYDNDWDGELDIWHGPAQSQSNLAWFKTLQYSHRPVDSVRIRKQTILEDLLQYKLLIYTHAAIMTDHTAELLRAYVEQGGQLVIGCRTGYKDENGRCRMTPIPGPIASLCGVTVDDYSAVVATKPAPRRKPFR
jgi:beta-galactosidase